jgi:hypothetical protein
MIMISCLGFRCPANDESDGEFTISLMRFLSSGKFISAEKAESDFPKEIQWVIR